MHDFVGTSDVVDYYSFSIAGSVSDFTVVLDGLSDWATLYLIEDKNGNGIVDSGEVLGSKSNNGYPFNPSLSINRWLDPGTYYVLVSQYDSGRNTEYDLILAIEWAESEQPQLKAPWRGTARITQGNNGSISHYDHGTWDNTYAIDMALPIGSDVLAPADGEVNYIDFDPAGRGGIELALEHTGPTGAEFVTVFLHLNEVLVTQDTFVTQGQVIAKSGDTGDFVTGPHLHFHLWSGEGSRDSHTIPIDRLVLKQVGADVDFREYDARKGELDDGNVAGRYFVSNNAQPPPEPPDPNVPPLPAPIEPSEPQKNKLIVVTGGWSGIGRWVSYVFPNEWTRTMAQSLKDMIENGDIDSSWEVREWPWMSESDTFFPWKAMTNGLEQGKLLAKSIVDANQWEHVHLVGHSAGSAVIGSAAQVLTDERAVGRFSGTIHLTFLDAYTPFDILDDTYGSTLGSNDWADNYYNSLTLGDFCWAGEPFLYALNVDLRNLGLISHAFPCDWYYATITGEYPDGVSLDDDNLFDGRRYGFPRSLDTGVANWQESLNLAVGNHPIGDPSGLGWIRHRTKTIVKKVQRFVDSYLVPSVTGIKDFLSDHMRLLTGSPVWVHMLVEIPDGSNYIKFTYQFDGLGEGYLTVYFNEKLVSTGDQRVDGSAPHGSENILVSDFMQEENWLTFRVDQIGQAQAGISILNINIGTITNLADLDDNLRVDVIDFALFARGWDLNDCNESNVWCMGCDLDYSGTVDINDLNIFVNNWLWTMPKHIPSDLNFNSRADFDDFNIFAGRWDADCNSPDWCYGCDFNKSGKVDIFDLEVFAEHWLEGTGP